MPYYSHANPLSAIQQRAPHSPYHRQNIRHQLRQGPLNFEDDVYKDVLRAAWVHCEVLHSNLNNKQHQALLNAFNNIRSSLKVLIIMVDVSSQGLNFQKASSRVMSLIPAKRSNPQTQAENRVFRVDQTENVRYHAPSSVISTTNIERLGRQHRQALFNPFNDQRSNLKVLIIMLDVSSQWSNLQKASSRVISLIPAKRCVDRRA